MKLDGFRKIVALVSLRWFETGGGRQKKFPWVVKIRRKKYKILSRGIEPNSLSQGPEACWTGKKIIF